MDIVGVDIASLTGYGVITFVALLVITDRLVWHTRLHEAEKQRDKWEGIALRALGTAEKMTVQAELTNTFLSKLPDPALQDEDTSI